MLIDRPAKKNIASKLKQLRESRGYTQAQIGQKMGKATTTVASWENSKGQPDADTLLKLCELYQIDSVLEEFGYRQPMGQISADERELLKNYRKLAKAQKQLIVQLAQGMVDIEAAEEPALPTLMVARGKGDPLPFAQEKIGSVKEMPDEKWKGE